MSFYSVNFQSGGQPPTKDFAASMTLTRAHKEVAKPPTPSPQCEVPWSNCWSTIAVAASGYTGCTGYEWPTCAVPVEWTWDQVAGGLNPYYAVGALPGSPVLFSVRYDAIVREYNSESGSVDPAKPSMGCNSTVAWHWFDMGEIGIDGTVVVPDGRTLSGSFGGMFKLTAVGEVLIVQALATGDAPDIDSAGYSIWVRAELSDGSFSVTFPLFRLYMFTDT